ncbi:MAG: phosphate ABC transporter substrate-binding protein PstS [Actinomycetia bacterium]|nr:phosphate ABC transporter substrate-binding protein PstS [Actinomycetes bacterium]
MKLRSAGSLGTLALVAALGLSACGSDSPTTPETPTGAETTPSDTTDEATDEATDEGTDEGAAGDLSGTLQASGASAQQAAMIAWAAGYAERQPGVTVNYDSVGSGTGRSNLLQGATVLAGSDSYLKPEEIESSYEVCGEGGAINLPVYISPIAVPFNLEGVDELNLSPTTLANIFNRSITSWDDPAIAADNEGVDLPSTPITAVNRSDDSGTTQNFVEYLKAVAPNEFDYEASNTWPVDGGEAAAQTSGVISVVQATDGAIGYADASAVGTLATANIGVGEEFVAYSPEAAARVVDASEFADTGVEGDLAIDLARDTTESGAYPIVLVSYQIVCTGYDDENTVNMIKDFVTYVASEEGQATSAENAGSAPISAELRDQINESLELITTK